MGRQLFNDRLDRIEAAVQRTAENLETDRRTLAEFRDVVRSAFNVQQEQISALRKTVEQVLREWQAHLRAIHQSR